MDHLNFLKYQMGQEILQIDYSTSVISAMPWQNFNTEPAFN